MFVAGVDGYRGEPGWVCFKVELPSRDTSVDVIDLRAWLKKRPPDLACIAIDIPIGLFDRSRTCDEKARKLLRSPRCFSVFSPPCRAALVATSYTAANCTNRLKTDKGLSQQAWGIAGKIKQVDDVMTRECQEWAFEVHPEICFWALNKGQPMRHSKKRKEGRVERRDLLEPEFPGIQSHLDNLPPHVGPDDLLDAAVAAWTALRRVQGKAEHVKPPECDDKGLSVTIYY